MKRHMDDMKLRATVRARMTHGSAFMLDHDNYAVRQEEVRQRLASMSREDILRTYPEYTYDVLR